MNKQKLVKLYKIILFTHKKKWVTDTCYNTNEPWKYDAKWKQSDIKDHIFYNSIYVNVQNRQIHIDSKYIRGCQSLGRGVEGNGEWLLITWEFFFSGNENAL